MTTPIILLTALGMQGIAAYPSPMKPFVTNANVISWNRFATSLGLQTVFVMRVTIMCIAFLMAMIAASLKFEMIFVILAFVTLTPLDIRQCTAPTIT